MSIDFAAWRRSIYVASSWRNADQPRVVQALRQAGHAVYDFRHPAPGERGFSWSEIGPAWQAWSPQMFIWGLSHPVACCGFELDLAGLDECDTCVLVLPCGRSAHLEAGYAVGCGKDLVIHLGAGPVEPELMYRFASHLVCSDRELLDLLAHPPSRHAVASARAPRNGALT